MAGTASAAGVTARQTSFDQDMIRLINAARIANGLSRVTEARGLTAMSVRWSAHLAGGATHFKLAHNPIAWTQVLINGAANRSAWGENVAVFGPRLPAARDLFAAYMASKVHRAIILGANFRFVGIGTVGGSGHYFDTIEFTDKVQTGQVIAAPVLVAGSLTASYAGRPLAGVTLSIRDATCGYQLGTRKTAANGATTAFSLYPGNYCLVAGTVPKGRSAPGAKAFTVTAGHQFKVAVAIR